MSTDSGEHAPHPHALEISRTLVLSTAHVSKATSEVLQTIVERRAIPDDKKPPCADGPPGMEAFPIVYAWDEYGWVIYTAEKIDANERATLVLYDHEALLACIALARANDCDWLRLDCDGPEGPGLEVFEW